jgi:hypothetical protein
MLQIASLESFLGSLWFAGLACLAGYIAGQVFPISKLASLLSRKG